MPYIVINSRNQNSPQTYNVCLNTKQKAHKYVENNSSGQ